VGGVWVSVSVQASRPGRGTPPGPCVVHDQARCPREVWDDAVRRQDQTAQRWVACAARPGGCFARTVCVPYVMRNGDISCTVLQLFGDGPCPRTDTARAPGTAFHRGAVRCT
jgi:hypothetical protein